MVLRIAYEQTGPDTAKPIVLLHGFPHDVREFDELRDRIARNRRRIIAPYLRGFGPRQYRSAAAFRSGQQAALGKDLIDLLDALKIDRATLVGYDWGSRAACVAAALWPERVRALVSINGYTAQEIAKASRLLQTPNRSINPGINGISKQNVVVQASIRTVTNSVHCCGNSGRPPGASQRPFSTSLLSLLKIKISFPL
jgi:pimeloyl-ACP methyl ester carboxylesterase